MRHLVELDGLRGILAWWVVFYHVFYLAGSPIGSNLFKKFMNGYNAVYVFMILSGLVICMLIDTKKEKFGPYLLRRFFRLWPTFVVCLGIGFFVFPIETEMWKHSFFDPVSEHAKFVVGRHQAVHDAPVLHTVFSVTLVHGMVPQFIFPAASFGMLPPGWSIAVEWQFYLVAPFVLFFFTSPKFANSQKITGLLLLLVLALPAHRWMPYSTAFLLPFTGYFLIGGLSYFALKLLNSEKIFFSPRQASFLALLMLAIFPFLDLAIQIWLVVFSLLAAPFFVTQLPPLPAFLSRALKHPLLVHLGNISYPTYLVHWPVLVLWMHFHLKCLRLSPLESFIFGVPAIIVPVYLSSLLIHHVIERPGMHIGKILAGRLARAEAP